MHSFALLYKKTANFAVPILLAPQVAVAVRHSRAKRQGKPLSAAPTRPGRPRPAAAESARNVWPMFPRASKLEFREIQTYLQISAQSKLKSNQLGTTLNS